MHNLQWLFTWTDWIDVKPIRTTWLRNLHFISPLFSKVPLMYGWAKYTMKEQQVQSGVNLAKFNRCLARVRIHFFQATYMKFDHKLQESDELFKEIIMDSRYFSASLMYTKGQSD